MREKDNKGKYIFSNKELLEMKRLYEEEKISSVALAKIYEVKSSSTIQTILHSMNTRMRNDKEKSLKYSFNENYFEEIDTEEKAYWLGFLYADGFLVKPVKHGSACLGLSLAIIDENHIYKFKNSINSTHKINTYINNTSYGEITYARILITNTKVVHDLIELGMVFSKTLVLEFPTFKQVPFNLINHFIRGYLDGDGYIASDGRLSFCGTKEFLSGLENYFISIGVKKIKWSQRWSEREVNNYEIKLSTIAGRKVLNTIYTNCSLYLDRKYLRVLEILK